MESETAKASLGYKLGRFEKRFKKDGKDTLSAEDARRARLEQGTDYGQEHVSIPALRGHRSLEYLRTTCPHTKAVTGNPI